MDALRHHRGQLLERGPDVAAPQNDTVALSASPHASGEDQRRLGPRRGYRYGVDRYPVVHPQIIVRDGWAPAGVVAAMVTITDACPMLRAARRSDFQS
eukprot:COSAG01_NODE_1909_length_8928_cov_64.180315_12_plen_98_part_00